MPRNTPEADAGQRRNDSCPAHGGRLSGSRGAAAAINLTGVGPRERGERRGLEGVLGLGTALLTMLTHEKSPFASPRSPRSPRFVSKVVHTGAALARRLLFAESRTS